MKQVKVFTTSNKRILATQDKINEWVLQEKINIESISVTQGAIYKGSLGSSFNEVEILITVLYSK